MAKTFVQKLTCILRYTESFRQTFRSYIICFVLKRHVNAYDRSQKSDLSKE